LEDLESADRQGVRRDACWRQAREVRLEPPPEQEDGEGQNWEEARDREASE
jgi:hypothetical protein